MNKKLLLTDEERKFLGLVTSAMVTNPFSIEQEQVMFQISGVPHGTPENKVRQRMVEVVTDRIQKMEAQGKNRLDRFEGNDKELIRNLFLFEAYYRYSNHFKDLIQRQLKEGEVPCKVSFANEVLHLLFQRGFTEERVLRRFALFYQIRRAYYFIDQALLGKSHSMRELRLKLWNNVFTNDIRWYEQYLYNHMEDFSTLLLGETGTGKGTAAAAIGRSGFIPFDEKRQCFVESFTKAFVSINLSQYSEQLIESELFGHKKGAFTGAIDTYEGVFARCSPYGAIFLDELGDVSMPIQTKLLQVFQERIFLPVGSHEKKRFSGRVVAATNKSLSTLRKEGAFRDDFFYRLCSDIIIVPPLRTRFQENPGELDDLVLHILQRLTGEAAPEFFGMVKRALLGSLPKEYAWPGNVRELEQAIRRVLLTREYLGDRKYVAADLRTRILREFEDGNLPAREVLGAYCALLYTRYSTYEEVARRTRLDRRTVKKYIQHWTEKAGNQP